MKQKVHSSSTSSREPRVVSQGNSPHNLLSRECTHLPGSPASHLWHPSENEAELSDSPQEEQAFKRDVCDPEKKLVSTLGLKTKAIIYIFLANFHLVL